MTVIIDYGVGNLFSLSGSLKALNIPAVISADPAVIQAADRLILPGVGAFGDAMAKLSATGLIPYIKNFAQTKPILGICLGMQLLFENSYEYGFHTGLGLLKGSVRPIAEELPQPLKIPHMGWNSLEKTKPSRLLTYVKDGEYVYYVHSYCATNCEESVTATSEYGIPITGAVEAGNVYGAQFHPEKSGRTGLNILRAFAEL